MKKTFSKIIAIFFLLTFWFVTNAQNQNNFLIGKNLDIYAHLLGELNINYVDSIDINDLVNASINAMLKKLDPYTNFITEEAADDFEVYTTGTYGGIGIDIIHNNEKTIVGRIHEGFAAHKAGFRSGDIFIEVNGVNVEEKNSNEIKELITGKPGKLLKIKLKRPNIDDTLNFELKTETIKISNVPYHTILDGNIGYIYLNSFTVNAAKEVKAAFLELKSFVNLKGCILDLRDNSGGLMYEAIEIVNMFVEKGQEIVSTKGKLTEKNVTYRATSSPLDLKIPLVVLINNNSASASEIVAGAIQDLDRGILIGQRSFGKGLVQNVIPLNYNTSVKLTTAKYYIPSGRCIQAIDYSHKNITDSFEKTPDSLILEFETSSGRKVYGGGGIEPDIKIEPKKISEISSNLYSKLLFFDYSVKYFSEHKNIVDIKDIKVTEDDYLDFVNYVKKKDFKYVSQSEKSLNELIDNVKKEKYYDLIKNQLEDLEKRIEYNKKTDFENYKNEIIQLLEIEIADKYFMKKGSIQISLRDNKEVEEAMRLLKFPNEYKKILLPFSQ